MSKKHNIINFRLSDTQLFDRLNETVEELCQSRSLVIRYALEAGLDVIDEEVRNGTCPLVESDETVHAPGAGER